MLHCMNSKKTACDQFSSNFATAIIFLATNRTFNFSRYIFDAMVKNGEAPSTSPSRITSSPSLPSHHTSSITLTTPPSTQHPHEAEEPATMPHDSHLHSVHSHGHDEGSLSLHELTVQEKASDDTKLVLQEDEPTKLVEDQGSGEKGEKEVTTPVSYQTYIRRRRGVSTASRQVSTASEIGSTPGVKAKDKGKAIMIETEPPKKIKKRVQVQMSIDEDLAKKILEEK
ncbi:hypothetical protein Tco_0536262 [Tanacetum coccineum]